MRAALEEEMRRVTVDDVLLQTVVSLVNLAGRKAGLAPGSEGERDLEQVAHRRSRAAARCCRSSRRATPTELGPIRDALSQLQMAYAQMSAPDQGPGGDPSGASRAGAPRAGEQPGPAMAAPPSAAPARKPGEAPARRRSPLSGRQEDPRAARR